MNINNILHNIGRFMFAGAAVMFILAFGELIAQLTATSLVNNWYSPGRLIELGAGLLLPVIAITLREIRDELHDGRP